jgi:hypothetical protein
MLIDRHPGRRFDQFHTHETGGHVRRGRSASRPSCSRGLSAAWALVTKTIREHGLNGWLETANNRLPVNFEGWSWPRAKRPIGYGRRAAPGSSGGAEIPGIGRSRRRPHSHRQHEDPEQCRPGSRRWRRPESAAEAPGAENAGARPAAQGWNGVERNGTPSW